MLLMQEQPKQLAHLTSAHQARLVLGSRITSRRERLGLTQKAVAEVSGLSESYVSRIESGHIPNPKFFDLSALAAALETTVAELTHDPPESSASDDPDDILAAFKRKYPHMSDTDRMLVEAVINKLHERH